MRDQGKVGFRIALALLLVLAFSGTAFAQSTSSTSTSSTAVNIAEGPTAICNALFPSSNSTGFSSSSSSQAGSQLQSIGFPASIDLTTAISACMLGLIVSFLVVGIGYVIGVIVPSSNVKNWLGREYWELTKSIILIAVIFSAIVIMASIGTLLTGGIQSSGTGGQQNYTNSVSSLVGSADSYLCTVNSYTNLAINNVVPVLIWAGLLQSIKVSYVGFPVPIPYLGAIRSGTSFNLWQSLLAQVEYVFLGQFMSLFIDFVIFLIIPMKVLFSSQIFLLPYLAGLGLTMLIPMGLIMRALPFVRGIGGTLIAYGIGFAVVWPSILLLFNAPVSSQFCSVLSPNFCTTTPSTTQPTSGTSTTLSSCTDVLFATGGAVGTAVGQAGGNSLLNIVVSSIYNFATSLLGSSSSSSSGASTSSLGIACAAINSFYPALNLMLQYGLILDLQLFVLFVLDLIIFYALVDNIARMLGGTIQLRLGRKLKLI